MTDWPLVPLQDAAEICGGGTPRREVPAYWNGRIPWLTPRDLPARDHGIARVEKTADYITEEGLQSSSARLLPRGTVLFSSRATIGKIGIATVPLATNQGFANLIPREQVDSRYLAWCLMCNTDQIAGLAGTTTFKEVPKSSLKLFRIPLAPLPEQRRLVGILDQAQRLRHLRLAADATAKRVLPALFIKMFGCPVTNPKGWPVKRFDAICSSRLGKMLDSKRETGAHRRPYLRNANVHWDRLALGNLLQMDFDQDERREFRLQRGDVLICEGGEVGRCAVWNDELLECYFQKALHRARPLPDTSVSEFIVYLLWELARLGALRDAAPRATFSHLTGVRLKALQVPVPPLELQKRFAERVRTFKRASGGPDSARGLHLLFESLLHRAFSGRPCGRLK